MGPLGPRRYIERGGGAFVLPVVPDGAQLVVPVAHWLCVEYTSGHPRRIRHIFGSALLYRVGERVHVAGETLCGVTFSHDESGARTDVLDALALGVSDDVRSVPADHCEACQRARLPTCN